MDVSNIGTRVQSIDVDDRVIRVGLQPMVNEITADEATTTGDEQLAYFGRVLVAR